MSSPGSSSSSQPAALGESVLTELQRIEAEQAERLRKDMHDFALVQDDLDITNNGTTTS